MREDKQSFDVSVVSLESFDMLCHNKTPAGPQYYDAVKKHSYEIAKEQLENPAEIKDFQGKTAVLNIPRGGTATCAGIFEAFNAAASGQVEIIDSRIKTTPETLFPENTFDDLQALVITDGVIGSGKTICDHLTQIPASWNGIVQVFANASAAYGLENIQKTSQEISRPVSCVIGRVFSEDECEWVEFNDKRVLFVGYNSEKRIDYQLPDIGDCIYSPNLV